MHFKKIATVAVVAALGVSAVPAPIPEGNAVTDAGPNVALTARNLALHSRGINDGIHKSSKGSRTSKRSSGSHKSRKSSHDGNHYRRIRSQSLTARALKRTAWKYYKVRSAVPDATPEPSQEAYDWDHKSQKSNKTHKTKSSHKSGKSGKSDKSHKYIRRSIAVRNAKAAPGDDGSDHKGNKSGKSDKSSLEHNHYPRRNVAVPNAEAQSSVDDLVRKWLGLEIRNAKPSPGGDNWDTKSHKSDKSHKSHKSHKSDKSHKSHKSHKSDKSKKGDYAVYRFAA